MLQQISLMLFPDDKEPYEWKPDALVYGEWAMHLVNPDNEVAKEFGYVWQISHIPSQAAVFMSKDRRELLCALRRLADISLPVRLEYKEDGTPHLPPIPPEFVRTTYPGLADLNIRAICAGYLYRPDEVWPRFQRSLEKRVQESHP